MLRTQTTIVVVVNGCFNVGVLCLHIHLQAKRGPDPFIDGHKPPCGCWALNSGRAASAFSH